MPLPPGPLIFVLGVKLAGYSLAARLISQAYDRDDFNSLSIGGIRTLFGVIGIVAYFGVLWCLFPKGWVESSGGGGGFVLGLIPIRLCEWWLLVWLVYDRRIARAALGWKIAALGTIWSFVLDAAILAITLAYVIVTNGGLGR